MVLDGLEKEIHMHCKLSDKVNYIRYTDDFVVNAKTPEILKVKVIPIVRKFLAAITGENQNHPY